MKTAVFIDGANVHYIQKKLGWEIDFSKLYSFLSKGQELYNIFYYTAVDKKSESYSEMRTFLDSLTYGGYTVRSKDVKIIKAGDKTFKKGNLDIEIAVDMFNTIDLYDRVILFSGDSDFERALELLRTHGKEILVISSKGFVSKELINVTDRYIDIIDLKKYIETTEESKEEEKKDTSKNPETPKRVRQTKTRRTPSRRLSKRPQSKGKEE